MHFRCADGCGNFAVPVGWFLLMIMVIAVFPVCLVRIFT